MVDGFGVLWYQYVYLSFENDIDFFGPCSFEKDCLALIELQMVDTPPAAIELFDVVLALQFHEIRDLEELVLDVLELFLISLVALDLECLDE